MKNHNFCYFTRNRASRQLVQICSLITVRNSYVDSKCKSICNVSNLHNSDITVYIKYNYAQIFAIFYRLLTIAHLLKF